MSSPSVPSWLGLIGWIVVCFAAAGIGGWASSGGYSDLVQPAWAPPSWLFGPVWTLLYLMMAVAAWLVWKEGGFEAHGGALTLFLVQLVLNALWTWLFFGWGLRGWASVEIVVLAVLIGVTLVAFWRVRTLAGALLVPYLAWVCFATALCMRIWWLNR
jgi:tryptophan-rich sensory protein